jgi:DNA-binding HxlR family transcriptional regulator
VGDRWTLLIVRDLRHGPKYFEDLKNAPEGIATNILSSRLRTLTEDGWIQQAPDAKDRRRVVYSLTSKGQSLIELAHAIANWGLKHLAGTRAAR